MASPATVATRHVLAGMPSPVRAHDEAHRARIKHNREMVAEKNRLSQERVHLEARRGRESKEAQAASLLAERQLAISRIQHETGKETLGASAAL